MSSLTRARPTTRNASRTIPMVRLSCRRHPGAMRRRPHASLKGSTHDPVRPLARCVEVGYNLAKGARRMTRPGDRYRVGVDIGGTFTDFVLVDGATGRVRLYKCLTTPKDPSAGALEGLEELLRSAGLTFADLGALVHGTTLVTNAIIERNGASLGLLTTRGFQDILEMGTEQRYDIYDLFLRFPDPLVPRAFRREVDERLDRDGRVVTPIDLGQVRREVSELAAAGIEALAVCFLHAYRNPAHERAVADLI